MRLLTNRRRRTNLATLVDNIKECVVDLEVKVREVVSDSFNQLMEKSGSDSARTAGYTTKDLLALRAKIQSGVSKVFGGQLEDDTSKISLSLFPGNFNFEFSC